MVVGLEFDKHIIENLTDENIVLSCARIEPPIHPESPEKITKDFGLEPDDFKYDEFKSYIKTLHGRMLVILLILLSLQRNIQIGLMP